MIVSITFPANPEMPEAVHDRAVAIVGGVHGGDLEEGLEQMQPLRELGTVAVRHVAARRRSSGCRRDSTRCSRATSSRRTGSRSTSTSSPTRRSTRSRPGRNDRPAPLTLVNTFHMGGAIADVGPEDTAFHERSSPYMVSIDGMWADPADNEANVGLGALGLGGRDASSAPGAST